MGSFFISVYIPKEFVKYWVSCLQLDFFCGNIMTAENIIGLLRAEEREYVIFYCK